MRNIELAIEKEKEYLRDKIEIGTPELDIHKYLYEAGYYNLDDFQFDKTEYLLKQQNIDIEHLFITENSLNEMVKRVMNKNTFASFADLESKELGLFAFCGLDFYDYDKFIENGVLPIKFNYSRGVIITSVEDFNFCICVPLSVGLTADFILKKLFYLIKSKNPTAVINNNDILVDDKKIVGLTDVNNNDMCVFGGHVSLADYTEIIYKLCPPKGYKEPGFITNITKQEFEEEVQSWLKP